MTLYAIRSYLENHFDEEISIMGLSRNFAMNEFKIKGGFKKLFATPVITFLTERRLMHARELLSQGNSSVDSIAAAAGYQHRSNFSIAFKRKFGMTPIEYRKKMNASR
jgi:AraC-like DNA-binding protein